MDSVNISASKTWSSIDIFLFSNGQKYSPPRKYHLRAEEIQWWGTTLNYLGRTHYGAGHSSIDLYTIDGIKINGPLELINGTAYVAVEPPDYFIDTGYEEYLLKASRSWEKRLSQKTNNTVLSNSDNKDIAIDEDATPEKNLISKIAEIGNDLSSPVERNSGRTKPQKLPQKKSITSSKPIQKKKLSITNNGTIKRTVCTDKIVPCPGKTFRNENRNRKRLSVVPCQRNVNQEQPSNKTNTSKVDAEKSEINPSNSFENVMYPLVLNNKFNSTDFIIDRNPNSSVSKKEDLKINIFNTKQNDSILKPDVKKINQTRQHNDFKEESEIFSNEENFNKLNPIPSCSHKETEAFLNNNGTKSEEGKRDLISGAPVVENLWDNKVYSEDTISNNRINFSEKQVTDEYIAYMNKGGLLLLKCNIKVKDCKIMFNRDKSKNILMTTSLTDHSKFEKKSQVDIDINFSGEFLTNDEQIHEKSIQSMLNKLYTKNPDDGDDKNPNIIIVQCACKNFSEINRDKYDTLLCECDNGQTRKFEEKQREFKTTSPSCNCNNETFNSSKCGPQNNFISVASENIDKSPLYRTDGMHVKNLAQKFETFVTFQNRTDNDLLNNNKESRNNNDIQYMIPTKLNDLLERSSEPVEKEDITTISNSVCDKSTQTDWCNVLLEARHHDDNNYTFHLPALYILKQLSYENM